MDDQGGWRHSTQPTRSFNASSRQLGVLERRAVHRTNSGREGIVRLRTFHLGDNRHVFFKVATCHPNPNMMPFGRLHAGAALVAAQLIIGNIETGNIITLATFQHFPLPRRHSGDVGSGPQRNLTIAETPNDLAKAGSRSSFGRPNFTPRRKKEYEGMWLERRTHKGYERVAKGRASATREP